MIFLNGLINAFPKTQHNWMLSSFIISNTHHLLSDLIKALDDLSSYRSLKIAYDIQELWLNFGFQLQQNIHKYQRLQKMLFHHSILNRFVVF